MRLYLLLLGIIFTDSVGGDTFVYIVVSNTYLYGVCIDHLCTVLRTIFFYL